MKSLFVRIFLWFCGATAVIVVVISAGFVADSPGALATNWRDLGQSAVVAAGRTAIDRYQEGKRPELNRYLESVAHDLGLRAALLDSSGRDLGESDFVADADVVAKLETHAEGKLSVFPRKGLAGVRLRGADGRSYLFLTVLPPRESGPWGRAFLASFIATGCLLCYLLARHVTSPVVHLRAVTSRFSEGDLTARITSTAVLKRKDEIGGLARDFNQMASRIETLWKAQQRLMADVSHELRSPITRLSLALGLMRRRKDADRGMSLARMEREVERLNALIGQLLTLSRLECTEKPPPMESFDLSALIQEIATDADFEATSLGRSVRLMECASCSMWGARDLVRSAIENVVRNAVKYTNVNTVVLIRLTRINGSRSASVVVEDQGPGVPEQELAHVFEPFYRVDEARQRHTGGSGLGLAIAQQVVTLHGGSVAAANRSAGGLELRIMLPVEEAFNS
jgi:two-component system, OmpR family, sensor histidine kinase CpxA